MSDKMESARGKIDAVDVEKSFMVKKGNTSIRESLALAETLARADLMTSPSAKRRLAARRVEMGAEQGGYVPPKQLLMYLVRMGSFNSTPKILNDDTQDNGFKLPSNLSVSGLINICREQRKYLPTLLPRSFSLAPRDVDQNGEEPVTKGVRMLQISKTCGQPASGPYNLRVLQWNILSQSLGQSNDNFVCCPEDALDWTNRKYNIVQGIVEYNPDIICLQEVDHFNFLRTVLATQGYEGFFFPKPDSPCLYIEGNNGPDGCAIFYRSNKFDVVKMETRILEVWRVQSNQVAIVVVLKIRETGQEVCVATTHLKARNGALLSKLRNEQGKDLLDFVRLHGGCSSRPLVLCGDFNAEPIEPIYNTVLTDESLGLASAYANLTPGTESDVKTSATREPAYTTWKIREDGEVCHTIDYVFYSHRSMSVQSVLDLPSGEDIGEYRVPSYRYPSDHFSLVCDFKLLNNVDKTREE